MSNFLQNCVTLATRRHLDNVALFSFSPSFVSDSVEFLGWMDRKFNAEFFNARVEMTRGVPKDAKYRNYRRRVDGAIDSATQLWGEVNGSVDAIESIMERVSREHYLHPSEVKQVSKAVFGH